MKEQVELRGFAIHEASHAVTDYCLGMELHRISIRRVDEFKAAVCESKPPHPVVLEGKGVFYEGTKERHQFLCHRIMMLQAGEVGQREFCPESVEPHHAFLDQAGAKRLIVICERYLNSAEREQCLQNLYDWTRKLLLDPRCKAAVFALTDELLRCQELSGDQAKVIIKKAVHQAVESAMAAGRPMTEFNCPHCEESDYSAWD